MSKTDTDVYNFTIELIPIMMKGIIHEDRAKSGFKATREDTIINKFLNGEFNDADANKIYKRGMRLLKELDKKFIAERYRQLMNGVDLSFDPFDSIPRLHFENYVTQLIQRFITDFRTKPDLPYIRDEEELFNTIANYMRSANMSKWLVDKFIEQYYNLNYYDYELILTRLNYLLAANDRSSTRNEYNPFDGKQLVEERDKLTSASDATRVTPAESLVSVHSIRQPQAKDYTKAYASKVLRAIDIENRSGNDTWMINDGDILTHMKDAVEFKLMDKSSYQTGFSQLNDDEISAITSKYKEVRDSSDPIKNYDIFYFDEESKKHAREFVFSYLPEVLQHIAQRNRTIPSMWKSDQRSIINELKNSVYVTKDRYKYNVGIDSLTPAEKDDIITQYLRLKNGDLTASSVSRERDTVTNNIPSVEIPSNITQQMNFLTRSKSTEMSRSINIPAFRKKASGFADGEVTYEDERYERPMLIPAYKNVLPASMQLGAKSRRVGTRGKRDREQFVEGIYNAQMQAKPNNKVLQKLYQDNTIPSQAGWNLLNTVAVQDVDISYNRNLITEESAWDWIARTGKDRWSVIRVDADGDGVEDDVIVLDQHDQARFINGYAVMGNNTRLEKYRAYLHGHPTPARRKAETFKAVRSRIEATNPFTIFMTMARTAYKLPIEQFKVGKGLDNATLMGTVQKAIGTFYRNKLWIPEFRKFFTNAAVDIYPDDLIHESFKAKPASEEAKQLKRMINSYRKEFSQHLMEYIADNHEDLMQQLSTQKSAQEFYAELEKELVNVNFNKNAKIAFYAQTMPNKRFDYVGDEKYMKYASYPISMSSGGMGEE